MVLNLPETGPVLLTSDAISRPDEIAEGFEGAWDATLAQASCDRLVALATAQSAFVIYGHCPEQWSILKKAPDHYG